TAPFLRTTTIVVTGNLKPSSGFCRRASTYPGRCRLLMPADPQPIPAPSTYPVDARRIKPVNEPHRPASLRLPTALRPNSGYADRPVDQLNRDRLPRRADGGKAEKPYRPLPTGRRRPAQPRARAVQVREAERGGELTAVPPVRGVQLQAHLPAQGP